MITPENTPKLNTRAPFAYLKSQLTEIDDKIRFVRWMLQKARMSSAKGYGDRVNLVETDGLSLKKSHFLSSHLRGNPLS